MIVPISSRETALKLSAFPQEPRLPDHSVLLESGPGFGRLGRYSFIAESPFLVVEARGRSIEIREATGGAQRLEADPLDVVRSLLNRFALPPQAGRPPLAEGGAIGFFGYDLRLCLEDLTRTGVDDLLLPDLWMGFYREIQREKVAGPSPCCARAAWACPPGSAAIDVPRPGTRSWLESSSPDPPNVRFETTGTSAAASITPPPRSSFSKAAYLAAVSRIQEYILAGDVYQVNLSQRFEAPLSLPSRDFFNRLSKANPAPFAAFLECGDFDIASVSPERFLWYDPITRDVETRPIKGTRPRGTTGETDRALCSDLDQSEKDRAENLMIVDLERNDLGRVCELGSVCVSDMWALEMHPTVWHLASTVKGTLRRGLDRIDLLRATFPGGSITGAPKIRAMQIIDEIEPTVRGPYTGAIGYLDFGGGMDLSIAIRTAIVKSGTAYFHVGGGIVADSEPLKEYQETLDKARAIIDVLREKA